jgi:alpha-1,2-mannosyltransferase
VADRKLTNRRVLFAAVGYVTSAALCCVLASNTHAPFGDLRIYRGAGAAFLHGAHLYDLRFAWQLRFTYPPFAGLVFTPLAAVPWPLLPPLVTAVSVILLPVTVWLALHLRGVPGGRPPGLAPRLRGVPGGRPPGLAPRLRGAAPSRLDGSSALTLALALSAVAVWLEPVRTNLAYGQINLVITALILYDLSRDDTARLKGAAIGLAAGLKLTPAIFVVYLAATRRYRAAAVAAATFILTVTAGFAVAPSDSAQFWAGPFASPLRVGRVENAANQSLRGALARLLHTTSVQPWWLAAAVVVGLAGLALAAIEGNRGNEAAGFSVCAVTGLLVSPVSWSHHWVLAVPALALLAVIAWQRRSVPMLAGAGAAAVVGWSRIIWQVPIGQGRHAELHLNPVQLGYADAYVLAGLAALALVAARLIRDFQRNRRAPAHVPSPHLPRRAWPVNLS